MKLTVLVDNNTLIDRHLQGERMKPEEPTAIVHFSPGVVIDMRAVELALDEIELHSLFQSG